MPTHHERMRALRKVIGEEIETTHILEHLRHQELEYAVQAGAMLAFNGLEIASLIGLLSVEAVARQMQDAVAAGLFYVSFAGCFVSSLLALWSVFVRGNYADRDGTRTAEAFIGENVANLDKKRAALRLSVLVGAIGSMTFAIEVFYCVTRARF